MATRAAVGALLLAVASGCAARGQGFSGRFVKPGEPGVSYDAPDPVKPADSLREYARRVRTVQANARPKSTLGSTIESHNPVLSAALLKLAMHESAAHHREVAAAYRASGINDYAYKHLAKAIRLEPCDAASYDALARLWRDWSMLDLALSDAHRAVYCSPNSSEAHNTLGTIFQTLGQVDNAQLAFQRAFALNPRSAFALSNLCYASLSRGDTGAARIECAAALALDPTLAAAQNNLALADAIAGDVTKAEQRLMQAADRSRGYYNVGVLRLAIGKYRDAATAFEKAVAEDPSLRIARERAAQARRAAAAAHEDQN